MPAKPRPNGPRDYESEREKYKTLRELHPLSFRDLAQHFPASDTILRLHFGEERLAQADIAQRLRVDAPWVGMTLKALRRWMGFDDPKQHEKVLAYGPAPMQLNKHDQETSYHIREMLSRDPKALDILPPLEKEYLLDHMGIGRVSRTLAEISRLPGFTETTVAAARRNAFAKLGLAIKNRSTRKK